LALPFPLGDRGAKPRQYDFKLTHRAAQLGEHGVEITYGRPVRMSMTSATSPALDVRCSVMVSSQ
jgi:hypothetical protein